MSDISRLVSTIFLLILMSFFMAFSAHAKTLKLAYDADPVTLDPHELLSGGVIQFSHMSFDPLIRWTKELGFEPRLAASWQRIDEKTMRFFLREGVNFHSGNAFTAKDVVYTLNRLKKSPDFKGIFVAFDGAVAVDDYTVDIKTNTPFPLLLNNATYIFPLDSEFYAGRDEISKDGNSFASRNVSGTGPFIVTEREQGVKVTFERFSDYWDKDSKGNVDKIILTPIKEDPTRVAALLAGDVGFAAPIPPVDYRRIKESKKVDLITMPGTRIIMFQLNQNRVEAFRDPRVRLAMDYAVNQEAISKKIMRGFATPAAQFSPAGYAGHVDSLLPRYDLAKAKQLMREAGYGDGFSITMMAPNNRYVNDEKIAQAVAAMFAKIGIKANLKTMPKAQYWPLFDERAADVMMIGWHSDTEDSNNFFEFLSACPDKETGFGQYNSGNYCNPEADKLMVTINAETETDKRAAMMQKIEKMLYDAAAFIPLHWQNLSWAAAKNVKAEPILNVTNSSYFGDLVIE